MRPAPSRCSARLPALTRVCGRQRKTTVVISGASAISMTAAGTTATPLVRRPVDRSARTSSNRPSAAWRAHAWQQCGDDRYRDDRVRQLEELVGVHVRGKRVGVADPVRQRRAPGRLPEVRDDDEPELVHRHVGQHPTAERDRFAQAVAAPVEPRSPSKARCAKRRPQARGFAARRPRSSRSRRAVSHRS